MPKDSSDKAGVNAKTEEAEGVQWRRSLPLQPKTHLRIGVSKREGISERSGGM
jgi:hypothetical protein